VNRIKAAQEALDGRVKRVYLEIGVSREGRSGVLPPRRRSPSTH
jgi:hypothetical protein